MQTFVPWHMIFACSPDLETIDRRLEIDGKVVAKWFSGSCFKLNDDNCHLLIFGDKCVRATVTISNSYINEFDNERLLARLSTYIDPIKSSKFMDSFRNCLKSLNFIDCH